MVNHFYGHNKKKLRNQINEQRRNVGLRGFDVSLLGSDQPKATYYNHIPKFNVEGDLQKPCGSEYPNLPNDPETQRKKGLIGLFPIPWDNRCKLEAQGKKCICNPKQEKVEEVKKESKTS